MLLYILTLLLDNRTSSVLLDVTATTYDTRYVGCGYVNGKVYIYIQIVCCQRHYEYNLITLLYVLGITKCLYNVTNGIYIIFICRVWYGNLHGMASCTRGTTSEKDS